MALNPTPSARSGEPYSWYWSYTENGIHHVCATQGGAWIRRLRTTLGLSASDIWDAELQAALIAQAQQSAASDSRWTPIVTALQYDLSTQIVSPLSARLGLYIAYYRPSGKRFDLIGIANNAVLPAWGIPSEPFDPTGFEGHTQDEFVCFVPGVDPPPPLSRADTSAAVLASQQGVRAGRSSAAPPEIVHGVSTEVGGLVLLGLGIVFFGGALWLYRRSTGPNR